MFGFWGASRFFIVSSWLIRFVVFGFERPGLFSIWLLALLLVFTVVRLPWGFPPYFLVGFCISWILSLFISCAVRYPVLVSEFLVGFIPRGISLPLGVVLGLVEAISYFIRPIILILRPVVNLIFGLVLFEFCIRFICVWCYDNHFIVIWDFIQGSVVVLVVFIYEWWVSFVQWFIVKNIVLNESNS